MRVVDLRSDTKTLPTGEMIEAIRVAELGDDVEQEDPTVNKLEELAAAKLGKEAGLLTTSGSQANLVAIMTHTKRGDEIFLEQQSHLYNSETGTLAAIAGCIPRTLGSNRGVIDPVEFEEAIRPPNIHFAKPTLICIENTHNWWGGAVIRPEPIRAIAEVAREHEMAVHCDGARIFNAAVALGMDVKNLVKDSDSVMFCVSKGLSAPIGSVVVGDEEFIEQARRNRKLLGGGMRQAGIIAAPAIVAIEKMVDRLREDHENARILGEGLAKMSVFDILPVETNIIIFEMKRLGISALEFGNQLQEKGILAYARGPIVRFVTHRGITRDDVEYALAQIEDIVTNLIKS